MLSVCSPLLRLYFSWWLPVTVPVSPFGLRALGTFPARPSAFVHLGMSWFLSLWKDSFTGEGLFVDSFSLLAFCTRQPAALWPPESLKSPDNLAAASCALGHLPPPLSQRSDCSVSLRGSLWVHLTPSSESCFDVYIHVFHPAWESQAIFLVSHCRDPRDADAGPLVVARPRSPRLCLLSFRLDTPLSYLRVP